MIILKILSIAWSLAFLASCRGQLKDSPPSLLTNSNNVSIEDIFSDRVPELTLHLHDETWRKMTTINTQGGYACEDEAPYGHVKLFTFKRPQDSGATTINNVGLRVKGNTTCDEPIDQKGFRISFRPLDKQIKDKDDNKVEVLRKIYEEWDKPLSYSQETVSTIKKQNLAGLKTLSLRRGSADPTFMRDTISSTVFAYGGELARRSNQLGAPRIGGQVFRAALGWVKFHNGFHPILQGHYGLAEIINDDAIEERFGKKGVKHLYKIKEGKGTFLLSDLPSNSQNLLDWYQPEIVDFEEPTLGRELEIKQKLCRDRRLESKDCDELERGIARSREVILGFGKRLNEIHSMPDKSASKKSFAELLDVDAITSYMVSANLTGHWDSLIGPISNNDYLMFNSASNRWSVFAWDLDNTLGTMGRDHVWMAGIYDFGVDLKYRPLFAAITEHFSEAYESKYKSYLSGVYDFNRINQLVATVRNRVAPESRDEKYENLFKFVQHRWANAWCQLYKSKRHFAVIENGWPKVKDSGGQKVAECVRR